MQILNFVILNSVVLFFLATKAAVTPPKIAQSTPPIAIITWGFSVESNANIGEAIDGNPTVIISICKKGSMLDLILCKQHIEEIINSEDDISTCKCNAAAAGK
jgi:hypothetical protein